MKIVNSINLWAEQVVIAIIIGAIIEIIIPNGKNKKYIKTVIGMYLLFVIMYPVINKITGKSIDISNISKNVTKETVSLDVNTYINSTYENNLKQEIKIYLKEEGYDVKNIFLKTGKTYEEINQINLDIIKLENANNINKIKEIEINTKKENTKDEENKISADEKNLIKEKISQFLNIDLEKININE